MNLYLKYSHMDGSTVNETNYKRKKLLYGTVQTKLGHKVPSDRPLLLGRFLSLLYSLSDMPTNIFYLPLNSRVDGSPTGLLFVVSKY